jgi:hypothetical protein
MGAFRADSPPCSRPYWCWTPSSPQWNSDRQFSCTGLAVTCSVAAYLAIFPQRASGCEKHVFAAYFFCRCPSVVGHTGPRPLDLLLPAVLFAGLCFNLVLMSSWEHHRERPRDLAGARIRRACSTAIRRRPVGCRFSRVLLVVVAWLARGRLSVRSLSWPTLPFLLPYYFDEYRPEVRHFQLTACPRSICLVERCPTLSVLQQRTSSLKPSRCNQILSTSAPLRNSGHSALFTVSAVQPGSCVRDDNSGHAVL